MRKVFLALACLFAVVNLFSQNVGIGTTTPAVKLDVKSPFSNVANFNGAPSMYVTFLESDVPRGYIGSYAGNPEDVDFGTYAGSTGKVHLTISDIPKLTINNAGNVGIGTISPNYLLHVTGGDLFLQSSSGSLRIGYDGSNQWKFATTGGGADLMLVSSPDGTTNNYRHYFDQSGNVGIGTGSTPPTTRLQVQTTASEVIRMNGANPYMSFYDNTDGYKGYLWYNGADMVMGSSSAAIRFASAGYRMTINTDGRVSIGPANTVATGYLLSVDGKVICEEARVQLSGSWPDYVFGDNYKLMPLEDLEKSIRQNKHLPNIPSAEEVTTQKGIDLGDMNKRLLEKVEELTLYLIELKKENKTLSERITRLEEKKD